MTRKDRTEGIYSRREVLDESERKQYNLIQLKELLSYAYRYSEDVKKRVENYINIVLSGNDPKTYQQAPAVLNDLAAENTTQFPTPGSIPAASPVSSQASISDDDSDLPF